MLIEISSSEPTGISRLGAEMIAAGFAFIDAPVSGSIKRAKDGSLAIMVGGEAAASTGPSRYRAGSGNLDGGHEWIFSLNAA